MYAVASSKVSLRAPRNNIIRGTLGITQKQNFKTGRHFGETENFGLSKTGLSISLMPLMQARVSELVVFLTSRNN